MIKFFELEKYLSESMPNPVYLLEGDDAFFRKEGLRILKDAFISLPDLNFVRYDFSDNVSTEGLLSALSQYPLGSRFRIVAVNEFYPKSEFIKNSLESFLKGFESTVLVISNEKKHQPFYKYEEIVQVDCFKESPNVIAKWIVNRLKSKNVSIDYVTAEKICEYCSADMVKINNEVNKLVDYYNEGDAVEEAAVNLLINKDLEYQIYEMTDFIGKRNFQLAISCISEMLNKGETPQRLLSAVYNYFRRLFLIGISDKTNVELAEILGVKEYAVKKSREQLKNFKIKDLKNALDMLADYDYYVKSGKITVNNAMILEVFKIMVGG